MVESARGGQTGAINCVFISKAFSFSLHFVYFDENNFISRDKILSEDHSLESDKASTITPDLEHE